MVRVGRWFLVILSLWAVLGCINPIDDPPLSYMLRFEPNGADGALESPYMLAPDFTLKRVGARIALPGSGTLTNGALFFQSWNTRSGGSGISYVPGSTLVMPADDVTLYAQWGPDASTFTVTFQTNGGTAVDPQEVAVGGSVVQPPEPTRIGYLFSGWFADDALTTPWNFASDVVNDNMTLYAGWVEDGTFAGGDGTEITPYLVATAEQLNNVRNHLGAHFLQVADIDLGVAPWNQDEGWLPLGENGAPFTGFFDGAGHMISGLFINRSTLGVGLFGYLAGATVVNVRLEGVSIANPGNNTGALAGAQQLPASSITRVSATGAVSSMGTNTGGLIGYANGAMLSESRADVAVTGDRSVGGLVGSMDGGEIRDSYATGLVAGTGDEGRIGGLVGNKIGGEVLRSYAAGAVTSVGGSPSGGLAGVNTGAITAAYYDRYTSGQDDVGKGDPLPTADMLGPASFPGWDFVAVWAVQEGSSYPYLRWQDAGETPYPQTAFSLRNPGPAGGPVFFDRGFYNDGWRYMEATADNLEYALWSSTLTSIGGTGADIGDGLNNTSLIVIGLGAQTGKAAQLAHGHAEGGFDDWFLPSIGELEQMDLALHPVADFGIASAPYWSSFEASDIQAAIWNFLSRDAAPVQKNTATYRVRGARRF